MEQIKFLQQGLDESSLSDLGISYTEKAKPWRLETNFKSKQSMLNDIHLSLIGLYLIACALSHDSDTAKKQ